MSTLLSVIVGLLISMAWAVPATIVAATRMTERFHANPACYFGFPKGFIRYQGEYLTLYFIWPLVLIRERRGGAR